MNLDGAIPYVSYWHQCGTEFHIKKASFFLISYDHHQIFIIQ
jgi:hypothetical protein